MSVIYTSSQAYIAAVPRSNIQARLERVGEIIDALYLQAAASTGNTPIQEYSLNDGQTIISETYRGHDSIMAAIKSYEAMEQRYINMLNGSVMRLVDEGSLKYKRRCR